MIVLDEQLLSYGLRAPIEQWYRGTVIDITQLRPNTVIRDDAIPMLLRAARQPTFVTINVTDFWRRLTPEVRFCIVCVAVPHTRALEVPALVRRLFALEPFRTRRQRLGKIARVSQRQVQYYTTERRTVYRLDWPRGDSKKKVL
jgi:hypothetical protein